MTTWAHNTAHYCGIWSGDPVWLRLRLRFSSFCSEQALLSIIFFSPAPITVPTRAGHFADSFRSLWKGYCRAERTKCFVRKDGFYFKVFPLIVHLCGELLLFEAKVSSRGWSECVCVRAGVCAPGARLLPPLFQFAVVNIQLYPRSEQSRESLLLYLFFSIEIPHCCWWPAASATAPRLPYYHYLWPARDRKPLLLSCLNIFPLNFILIFYLCVCVFIYVLEQVGENDVGGVWCSSVGVVLECAAAVVVLWVFVRPLPFRKSMTVRSCCHFIYDALVVLCLLCAERCMSAQLYGKASPSQMSQGAPLYFSAVRGNWTKSQPRLLTINQPWKCRGLFCLSEWGSGKRE